MAGAIVSSTITKKTPNVAIFPETFNLPATFSSVFCKFCVLCNPDITNIDTNKLGANVFEKSIFFIIIQQNNKIN
jgi:hypothetical protein